MNFRLCAILGSLSFAASVGAAEPDIRSPSPAVVELTLDEALAKAVHVSPQIIQAQGAVRSAQASQRTAFGAYLPTASANASVALTSAERFNAATGTAIAGSSGSYSAGLAVGWDVFTGLRRGALTGRANAQLASAQATLEGQRFEVALSVQQAFFDALRADEMRAMGQSQMGRAQQAAKAAGQRMTAGTGTRSDSLRAELEVRTAREAILTAEAQGVAARYSLGRWVGANGPAKPKAAGSWIVRALPMTEEALIDQIVASAPSVKAAVAAADAATATVKVSRAAYFPTARLSAGYDWFNPELFPITGRSSWNVRFGLSFPIFDGFQRDETITRARVDERNAIAALEDTRRSVRAEAAQAVAQLSLQAERIDLAQGAVEVAREDFRVQDERYRLGVSTMLDLLTSQSNLAQAETDWVGAKFDYQLARAQLEAIAGRTL